MHVQTIGHIARARHGGERPDAHLVQAIAVDHILGDSKYGNNTANRELKLKYQALCAWELTMPHFNQPDFEFLSGKTFHAPKPWYYQQVLDGTLK